MIVFDLDGTLADCEHRRHFIDPQFDEDAVKEYDEVDRYGIAIDEDKFKWFNSQGKQWRPDWDSFFEACDKDEPIKPTVDMYKSINWENDDTYGIVQIWSSRSESVIEKTQNWLWYHCGCGFNPICKKYNILKMRPIGDYTPDEDLKERWLDEALAKGETIEYVFDDRPKVIRMWRRRGIFVFDCNQKGDEF